MLIYKNKDTGIYAGDVLVIKTKAVFTQAVCQSDFAERYDLDR
jgi:hypothetical protein